MSTIVIPKNVTELEIEDILSQFLQPSYSTHLDFSETEFISPFASILLILIIESTAKRKVHFILSKSSKMNPCMFILARLGFFENLPSGITFYPFKPKSKLNVQGKNDAILEITRIKEQDAMSVINKVEKAIETNTNYQKGEKFDICIMVSEMIQNIFYHSESPKSGIIAVQKFLRMNIMQMIIADAEVGIPSTLMKSDEYKNIRMSDSKAIIESLKKGVSRLGKGEDRGEGLTRCVDLASKHRAKLYIRSNKGFASLTSEKNNILLGDRDFLSGTQISIDFPCK